MRRRPVWFALSVGLFFVGVLAWAASVGWRYLADQNTAEAAILEPGHQEVAWICPAISGDRWERLVAALKNLEKEWATTHPDLPPLRVSFQDAFLEQTASIPQIALYFVGFEQAKLWIRWYKLSGEIQHRQWLEKLHKRGRPPLAIIGGDSSDRALATARELQNMATWAAPLFLVTTATVNQYDDSDSGTASDLTVSRYPKFMDVYKGRTFRFCFTNEHIARAVLDFVHDNPQLWAERRIGPTTLALMVPQGNSLSSLGALAASSYFPPVHLSAIAWEDDRYSQDLANRMFNVFVEIFYHGRIFNATPHYRCHYVSYSVGGFYQPNPRELQKLDSFLKESSVRTGHHHLLAVPTGVQPARRLLRTLCRRAPAELHDLVVITGDSISFNHVYRDGDLEWNVLEIPVPLVFFSHRNPIDASAGFRQRNDTQSLNRSDSANDAFHTTGSNDLLLLRDVVEAFVQAAWNQTAWSADPSTVCEKLRQSRWSEGRVQQKSGPGRPLFDAEGNRSPHTGEHMVWLKPIIEQARVLPSAIISVWRIDRQIADTRTWERVGEPILVNYHQRRELGTGP